MTTVASHIDKLLVRCPVGVSRVSWLALLNETWSTILRDVALVFETTAVDVQVNPANGLFGVFAAGPPATYTFPADFDPGRPAQLYGRSASPTQATRLSIPYMSIEDYLKQRVPGLNVPRGLFSAWTFRWDGVQKCYLGQVGPKECWPNVGEVHELTFIYHMTPTTYAETDSLPIPGAFEWLVTDLVELEKRRQLGLSGIQLLNAKVEAGMRSLSDALRTTKPDLAGLADRVALAQARQAEKGA